MKRSITKKTRKAKAGEAPPPQGRKLAARRVRKYGESVGNIAKILDTPRLIDEKRLSVIADDLSTKDLVLALGEIKKMLMFVAKALEAPTPPSWVTILKDPPPPPIFKGSMCFSPGPLDDRGPEDSPRTKDH